MTTLRIGGPARFFANAKNEGMLVDAVREAIDAGISWRIIGLGSNILAADTGTSKAIIRFVDNTAPKRENTSLEVSGGTPLWDLITRCVEWGLGGLEDLAGIPGTVGGAISGNAGAYGTSISQCVQSVRILRRDGSIDTIGGSELDFIYRSSAIKRKGDAILSATLALDAQSPKTMAALTQERMADRKKKHPNPNEIPTAGSFFKNPNDANGKRIAAGKLIEACGCRELSVGGAHLWKHHANIVVTDGTATARNVLDLTELMSARVADRFDIHLEREVVWVD